ncbi:hypothetical protein E2C01_074119 [Portunus trituberculatus]|uniref:Secreted protein n=1 Tax=Portunus trituberculatus TaxID=210409 RepID=A0A5B7IGA1_PORTR|nr:hypothetical protein [Portunus trituberculatus]
MVRLACVFLLWCLFVPYGHRAAALLHDHLTSLEYIFSVDETARVPLLSLGSGAIWGTKLETQDTEKGLRWWLEGLVAACLCCEVFEDRCRCWARRNKKMMK